MELKETHMELTRQIPFYIKLSQIIVGVIAFFYVMYIGQDILVPLIFALILAILINPLVNYLQRIGCNRVLSIFIAVFLTFLITVAIVYFISAQLTTFGDAMPQLKEKFNFLLNNMVHWV